MRFMHLADLHLGKVVHGYSLIEDQKYALDRILDLIAAEKIENLIIAGDIYQVSQPGADAIKVFDSFLSSLNKRGIRVLIISGNHDSSERLAYLRDFLKFSNIYISSPYQGQIEKVTLEDEHGPINFYLFPYVKPLDVKPYFKDQEIKTYAQAIEAVIESIDLDESQRNVMISHQFILNAQMSESEEIYAGTLEAVSQAYYEKFDYTALGHIHKKQSFAGGKIRYPGALLKFSASEANYEKNITIVQMGAKGDLEISEHKIDYLRDMRIIRDYFDNIIRDLDQDDKRDDYVHIELLDDEEIENGRQILTKYYPKLMSYRFASNIIGDQDIESIDLKEYSNNPYTLFEEFYKVVMNRDLDEATKEIIDSSIDEVWGSNED